MVEEQREKYGPSLAMVRAEVEAELVQAEDS